MFGLQPRAQRLLQQLSLYCRVIETEIAVYEKYEKKRIFILTYYY